MCEAPPRNWRHVLRPQQILLGVGGLGIMAIGTFNLDNSAASITLISLAGFLLLGAVFMPAITQVEFGIPSGLKIAAGLKGREESMRRAFEEQRPDLAQCASLLCDDPSTASDLLTAAMARATLGWRGPVDREIRVYVLCWFVHRLMAHARLVGPPPPQQAARRTNVSDLTLVQRILLVLNEFADIPVDQIGPMVGLSAAEAAAELRRAQDALLRAAGNGGARR